MNDHGQDLELRLVRYFITVAEEGNFGRAAAALHVAQPALSRQVKRLEQQMGVRLLDRTPQGSRLTEAGKAFLPEAQVLLRAARQAQSIARAHAPAPRLTIGFAEDLVITGAVRALRLRHPDAEIGTRHLDCEQVGALPAGHVDVLVARGPLPFPDGEVVAEVLYDEPRVLVVPLGHRLAGRASVTMLDLADERPLPCSAGAPYWGTYQPAGHGSSTPAAPTGSEDKLELVASGQAIAVLPRGDRRSTLRRGLTIVPLDGAPTSEVVLASRVGDRNPLISAFRVIARERVVGLAA